MLNQHGKGSIFPLSAFLRGRKLHNRIQISGNSEVLYGETAFIFKNHPRI